MANSVTISYPSRDLYNTRPPPDCVRIGSTGHERIINSYIQSTLNVSIISTMGRAVVQYLAVLSEELS